jgi:hypothetical protein
VIPLLGRYKIEPPSDVLSGPSIRSFYGFIVALSAEHIGHGYIGEDGFRRILNHSKLRTKAFILETPVDEEGDELRNMESLKKLGRESSRSR